MTSELCCFAPAKINLYLHITGRREDGYHELDSLAVFANVGDIITVEPGDGLHLRITGPYAHELSQDGDNLVLQAAQLLAAQARIPANIHITLEKNLPVASGMGGGSSDAAATLKALSDYWKLHPSDDDIHFVSRDIITKPENALALASLLSTWRDDVADAHLHDIARALGADVPVCLERCALYMGGVGDSLSLAPHLPSCWLVLVNPGVCVPTPQVFRAWAQNHQGPFSTSGRFSTETGDAQALAEILKTRTNDLAAPAIAMAPEIQTVLDALHAHNGVLLARMSGSGATCFGLCADEPTAQSVAQTISQVHPDWWCVAAKMITSPLEI